MGLMAGVKAVCGRAKCGWIVAVRFKKRVTGKHKIELFGHMIMCRVI